MVEGHLLVGTFRGARSQWVRNAAATPDVSYWLMGSERRGRALALVHGLPPPDSGDLPPLVRVLVDGPMRAALPFGWAFIVVAPVPSI